MAAAGASYGDIADYAGRQGIHGNSARPYILRAISRARQGGIITPDEWRGRADELAGEVARLTADNAALRAQLAAREHAACPRCGQSLHGEKLLPF